MITAVILRYFVLTITEYSIHEMGNIHNHLILVSVSGIGL